MAEMIVAAQPTFSNKEECNNETVIPIIKEANSEQIVIARFLIYVKSAGLIIGKNGINIKRLRQQYEATIMVTSCKGPEQILSIELENNKLRYVLADIIPKLKKYSGEINNPKYELRMLLDQDCVGCIIGKGGCQIMALRDKYKAPIKVYTECCPFSTERIIQVYGELSIVLNCISEIVCLVSYAPNNIGTSFYNPHNFDSKFVEKYGGYNHENENVEASNDRRSSNLATGNSPSKIENLPKTVHQLSYISTVKNQLISNCSENNSAPAKEKLWTHKLPKSSTNIINEDKLPLLVTNGPLGNLPSTQTVQGSKLNPDSIYSLFNCHPFFDEEKQTMMSCITIPSNFSGTIIGKGGHRISKISTDTGTNIIIKKLPDNEFSSMTITGPLEQVIYAQFLLYESLCQYHIQTIST